jgi:LysR family transcriptional regulator, glycine cleavage system transcriptional activator
MRKARANSTGDGQIEARLPLGALQAFERAATLGSFKLAGDSLHRTASAVSHQVRDLEVAFGQALFTRQHRAIELTPTGRRLAVALRPALRSIGKACADIGLPRVKDLRLSIASGYASVYVLPRLAELQALLPEHRISIDCTSERADVAGGEADLAIRFGPRPVGDVEARLLRSDPSWAVAALSSFGRGGQLKKRLERMTLLAMRQQPQLWDEAFAQLGVRHTGHRLSFDSFSAVMDAAERGLGVALSPAAVCEQQIAQGRLKRVGLHNFDNGWGYWLLASPQALRRRAVAVASEWLRQPHVALVR